MKKIKSVKVVGALLAIVIVFSLTACGKQEEVVIDYADAESFEMALNNGENLEGKIVSFMVQEIHPESALGYNVWAGEHLNFVSERNPDIAVNEQITVKVNAIENILGSWVIKYEKIENAMVGETTISFQSTGESSEESEINGEIEQETVENVDAVLEDNSSSMGTASFSVERENEEKKALELIEYGWYIEPNLLGSNTIYVDFCGLIHNPNTELAANYPKINATVKNGEGSILATESQVGNCIMPEDTITLVGMMSLSASNITEDTQISFDVECSDFTSATVDNRPKTTDFIIENVSEQKGSMYSITGEVTNRTSETVDMINLTIILRKEGKIVYMESSFMENLQPEKTKAFEVKRFSEWPEHDTIDVSAQVWM
ncbi:MAG: hypothetical protein K2O59_03420 [Lachnospiraceae bacterium]|nr:hypothetical protein [Lachnospiraceae bacterium]